MIIFRRLSTFFVVGLGFIVSLSGQSAQGFIGIGLSGNLSQHQRYYEQNTLWSLQPQVQVGVIVDSKWSLAITGTYKGIDKTYLSSLPTPIPLSDNEQTYRRTMSFMDLGVQGRYYGNTTSGAIQPFFSAGLYSAWILGGQISRPLHPDEQIRQEQVSQPFAYDGIKLGLGTGLTYPLTRKLQISMYAEFQNALSDYFKANQYDFQLGLLLQVPLSP